MKDKEISTTQIKGNRSFLQSEQEQVNLSMDFRKVKTKTTKQACRMHIRKTMRSPSLKECKTLIKTFLKWTIRQSLTSQTVISQMKRITLRMKLMVNSFKSHFNRYTLLRI